MPDTDSHDELIRQVLTSSRKIAIGGASTKPDRASNLVMRFLIDRGYDVYPVNPQTDHEEIWGRKVYPSLAAIPEPIEIVDVFRRSEAAGGVCDEAIAKGARTVWMQLGVINEAGAVRARAAGLNVIMDRCPRIEIPRLNIAGPASAIF